MNRSLSLRRVAIAPRVALSVIAVMVALAAALTAFVPTGPAVPTVPAPALSERLGPRTWALAIPLGWLSTPVPGVRDDDVLDILGVRPSERATASEVATGVRVMSVDERTLVVELTAEDASALASARARGLSLIAILRSRR